MFLEANYLKKERTDDKIKKDMKPLFRDLLMVAVSEKRYRPFYPQVSITLQNNINITIFYAP